MAAFLIAEIEDITDSDGMTAYGERATETIGRHGGRIVAARRPETVEGDWSPRRVVIVQFDDMDKLKTWYYSPEYQALIKERHAAARSNLIFVEGM